MTRWMRIGRRRGLAGAAMGLALLAAAMAVPGAAPAQVKLSRSAICHCPGGAYWERTIHFTAHPSIESCLGAGGRHPKQGQGDCDAPGMAAAAAARDPAPRVCDGPCYDRALFGGWADEDGDCRSTRHEVLAALSTVAVRWSPDGCEVERGRWIDPYTGDIHLDAGGLDVDHVVPLAYAWARGADGWGAEARERFANDPANLIPTEAQVNRSKGARGPLAWLPPDEGARCAYVLRFARVARTYDLRLPDKEARGIDVLRDEACG